MEASNTVPKCSENANQCCFFCYKSFKEQLDSNEFESRQKLYDGTTKMFYNFVRRHLNFDFNISGKSTKESEHDSQASLSPHISSNCCCPDCFQIIEQYCELYDQIEYLELKLNWQLEKLRDVMKAADKVPSRLKAFREWYNDQKNDPVKAGIELQGRDAITDFRKGLKKRCKRHGSKLFPRVYIAPFRTNSVSSAELNAEKERDGPSTLVNNIGETNSVIDTDVNDVITTNEQCSVEKTTQPIITEKEANISPTENTRDISTLKSVETSFDDCRITSTHSTNPTTVTDPQNLEVEVEKPQIAFHKTEAEHDVISGYESPVDTFDDDDSLAEDFHVDTTALASMGTTVSIISKPPPPEKAFPRPPTELESPPSVIITAIKNEALSKPFVVKAPAEHEEHLEKGNLSPTFPQKRSLRNVFKCQICSATFSSSCKLELHSATKHNSQKINESLMDGQSSDDDDEDGTPPMAKKRLRCDTGKDVTRKMEADTEWNSSSDWDSEPSSHSFTDSESEIENDKHNGKKKTSLPSKKKSYSCIKCDPVVQFALKGEFQVHDRYLHSNGTVPFRSDRMPGLSMERCKFENFPSEIRRHPCSSKKCPKVFALPQEQENHFKVYHITGTYKCNFCDVTKSVATDLISHELNHSNSQQKKKDKHFKPGEHFVCGRCGVISKHRQEFVSHYLEAHLDLPPIRATCPICKQIFRYAEQVPLNHYVNCHDLNRLNDPSKPFRCESESECCAYFLTEDQLHVHRNKVHHLERVAGLEENAHKAKRAKNRKLIRDKHRLKPKAHKCPHCFKNFTFEREVRFHVWRKHRKHSEGKANAQGALGKSVISSAPDNLTVDDLVYDYKAKYFCAEEECKKGFMREVDLTNHSKLHGQFKCNFCEMTKNFAPDLSSHELVHEPESNNNGLHKWPRMKYSCLRCDFASKAFQQYVTHHVEIHLQLVMDKKRCPICKYVYMYDGRDFSYKDLKTAIIQHFVDFHELDEDKEGEGSEAKVYKCSEDECTAYFRTALQLQQHLWDVHENVSKEERHKCQDCGRCLSTAKYLKYHRINIHKVSPEDFEFACDVPDCEERFEREMELEYHRKFVHPAGVEAMECPEKCGKKFWSKPGLLSHVKRHREKPMHVCQICGKAFWTEHYLKCHLKTHTTPKPLHVCEECGKQFKTKEKLDQHKHFHAGPETWKFSCSICSKKVFSKQKLEEHTRTHTKEKPFVCQICGAAYAHRHNLRNHANSKHGAQDIPKPYDKSNSASSKKGKKFKAK